MLRNLFAVRGGGARLMSSQFKATRQFAAGLSTERKPNMEAMDGNQAAAYVAYGMSENAFIYPISPATSMGEMADAWSASGKKNVYGTVPLVRTMQSEAGAAGAVHGALTAGGLATTFTASQGLLLMIPNMFLIAGELMPCVLHVSARTVAKHALSIFNDHTDVMSTRQCGWAMLCSNNSQEVMDLALVSHLATLKSRVPFLHFFDGYRTSAQVNKIDVIPYDAMQTLVPHEAVKAHVRDPALNPNTPAIRGTGQRPDIWFQGAVAANKYYQATPEIVQETMNEVATITGRQYKLFDYYGDENAKHVLVAMGSANGTIEETIDFMRSKGESVGVVKPRLFRPWSAEDFRAVLPASAERICVLDRVREEGAFGQPLYLDVQSCMADVGDHRMVIGGQFGLSSKEFTPSQVVAIFDNLKQPEPKKRFVVGVNDDVTHTSLSVGEEINTLPEGTKQCLFWGLGTDGTVGANKEAIKVIGANTDMWTQGHFAYDSHKGGGVTMSHLRFGPEFVKAEYEIIRDCDYIACHNTTYVNKFDMIKTAGENGVFVLNSPWSQEDMETRIPDRMKRQIHDKKLQFYNIDASRIAVEMGMGLRVNTIMQAVFYHLSKVIEPPEEAIKLLKESIVRAYTKKGPEVVALNHKMVDAALGNLVKIDVPASWGTVGENQSVLDVVYARPGVKRGEEDSIPGFVTNIMDPVLALEGDALPVSAFTPGGYMESGTCEFEKRGIAPEIPVWIGDTCTQCNYCAIVCPHAVVRPFLLDKAEAKAAPADFEMRKAQGGAETAGYQYTIQLASMDCTGCAVCVQSCPDDSLYMAPYTQVAETQIPHWEYAFSLPNKHDLVDKYSVKGSQFQQPLMEFSGACAGCGETPYVKLLTQLFGERLMIANASGCSSVWGGTATTNPYTRNKESGRGPAWGRSLFEDNAEYGFGMLLGRRQRRLQVAGLATDVLEDSSMQLPDDLRATLSQWVQYQNHPDKSVELADSLASSLADARASNPKLDQLYQMRDMMPYSSQWIIGGDGWAYDIGYGGVDWVLSRGENVNILVLDTEMYSNTGGQLSGATPQAAQIKFASAGKPNSKKDLGQLAMMYGNVYVASIAMGADYAQSLKAIKEAEEYDGPSLIIAYSPCIDWGLDMKYMMDVQKTAVDSGYWTLYRYDPRNTEQGKNPFQLDSKRIKIDMEKLLSKENRFRNLKRTQKDRADVLQEQLKARSKNRHSKFKRMSLDDEELLETLKEQIGESTGEKMTILYASETGNTEALALQLQYEMKRRDVKAKCMAFDDLDIADLPKQNVVINLAATCGQGEYPANSRMFWDAINDPELPSDFLANTRFATFAMGDSHYVYFNEVGKRIDERFAELGGQRIQEIGMGDDQEEDKWETQWIDWEPNLFGELGTMEPPKELMDATHIIRPNEAHEPVRPSIVPPGATVVPLTTNVMITPGGRDNRHYEFDLKGTNVNYSCGDSLGVYPHNDPKMVEEFLDTLNLKMDTVLECNDLSGARKPPLPEKVTAGQLFTEVLDIFGKPKRQFYDVLSMAVTDEKERETLEYWMSKEGKADFRSNCTDETVTYADLLQMFPSAMPKFDLAYMIDFISPIKPRLYSIASAQETVGEEVHLCIVENDWDTPKGKFQRGACTSYLMRQDPAMNPQVAVRVNPAAIAMPSSQKTPMIMCGLGTGYAPFRAFMQERRTMRDRDGEEVGPMALYFGARHKATEFLYGCGDTEYANEIDDFQKDGILTELVCAFSRDQEKKVYVQNRMQENYEMLYEYLVEKEGFFYLCGPSGPVVPVRQAVVDSLVHVGKRTPEEAEAYVTNMQITGRYNVEVW